MIDSYLLQILHGDLSTRNILLAENNIVKICDLGLAKTLYDNEYYKKKSTKVWTQQIATTTRVQRFRFGVFPDEIIFDFRISCR